MVAVSRMPPTDPDERESVRRVLCEHPGLQAFIERVSQHALEQIPGAEWDSPIRVFATAPYAERTEFSRAGSAWTTWLLDQHEYDLSRVAVMAMPHHVRHRIA